MFTSIALGERSQPEPSEASEAPETPPRPSRSALLIRVGVLLLIVAVVVVIFVLLPVDDWILAIFDWVTELGAIGPVIVASAYIVFTIFLIPGSLLTLGCGFLFDFWIAWATVTVGSVLGATGAFLVGKYFAGEWVKKKLQKYPKWNAVLDSLANGNNGYLVVGLCRLSPVLPFVLLNYAFGISPVPVKTYFISSLFGMVPGTVAYVYIGSLARSLVELSQGELSEEGQMINTIFFIFGGVVTFIVVVIITIVAKRTLQRVITQQRNPSVSELVSVETRPAVSTPSTTLPGPAPDKKDDHDDGAGGESSDENELDERTPLQRRRSGVAK